MPGLQQLERLNVQVLVDNVTDFLSTTPAFVTREWTTLQRKGALRMSGASMCCANHGLSLVITGHHRGRSHTLLFDAGPVQYTVEHNGTRLGIDFAAIEAVVLSHGHWDHAGGLPKAFELINAANGGRAVPCFLHPGMFEERGLKMSDGGVFPLESVPSPDELRANGAEPVVVATPQYVLDDMFFISGEIPRITAYERGLPSQVRRAADGTGWEPDPLVSDERFVAARVAGKGIVVFTACSHAGVVNVLKHAQSCFPTEKLHAVMGGFHLSGENEAIIPETVRDLAGFELPVIAPAHCTGWRAISALVQRFGDAVVVPSAVGKSFAF